MRRLGLALVALIAFAFPAYAQGYNGSGSITRPANITAYAANTLFAPVTPAAMTITVHDTVAGANLITGARLWTTGTGASGAMYKVFLFALTPANSTTLGDQSTYVGPYAADTGSYIGSLTCSGMRSTNDSTPQFFSDCSADNPLNSSLRFNGISPITTIYGMISVTTGYTPISGEKITLQVSSIRGE